jgi:hypothetical protein
MECSSVRSLIVDTFNNVNLSLALALGPTEIDQRPTSDYDTHPIWPLCFVRFPDGWPCSIQVVSFVQLNWMKWKRTRILEAYDEVRIYT